MILAGVGFIVLITTGKTVRAIGKGELLWDVKLCGCAAPDFGLLP
jgi:hypothetical protein